MVWFPVALSKLLTLCVAAFFNLVIKRYCQCHAICLQINIKFKTILNWGTTKWNQFPSEKKGNLKSQAESLIADYWMRQTSFFQGKRQVEAAHRADKAMEVAAMRISVSKGVWDIHYSWWDSPWGWIFESPLVSRKSLLRCDISRI